MTEKSNKVVIRDVAAKAGVSVATVSRVLADRPHVRPELQKRVRAAVAELGYVPDRSAQSLRKQRSRIVGLIVPDIENPFFTTIARAVEDTAHKHQLAVFLCNSDEEAAKEAFYLELLQAEKVAGIILAPTDTDGRVYAELGKNLPMVAIDRTARCAGIDSIVTNNEETARRLVEMLIAQGHDRIPALLADQQISTARLRYQGYRHAMHAAGLEIDQDLVLIGRPVEADGYRLTWEFFEDPASRPTALFSSTKLMTLGAIRALTELGLRVPDDVAVAAYDMPSYLTGNIPEFIAEQPTYDMGTMAMQLLLTRMADAERPQQTITMDSRIHLPTRKVPI